MSDVFANARALRAIAKSAGVAVEDLLDLARAAQGMPREATRREGGSGASAPASPVTK